MDEGLRLLLILITRVLYHVKLNGRLTMEEKSEILSSLFTIAKFHYSQKDFHTICNPQKDRISYNIWDASSKCIDSLADAICVSMYTKKRRYAPSVVYMFKYYEHCM